ncbi:MAG TPA: DUF192 domain-containing protein [Acidimicrobiales bacterium]|jgi:uncharacterized membrane protein (UPF0127 family)|nr:DUF192 domain-containing protein [Acidimicrobiales bacterium]
MRDTDRRTRQLLWAAVAVFVVGVLAFVVDGADRPADPVLDPSPTTATGQPMASAPADLPPPGDPARVPLDGFDEVAVRVLPEGGTDWLAWCLLAARTAAQRGRGLMEVTDLQGYSGMAFVYDEDVQNAFYMRNTPTPLSIAWVSVDGRVVSTADMAPCEDREGCPTYPPAGPYRYALEVFQGGLPDLGITAGATVEVGGACAPRT